GMDLEFIRSLNDYIIGGRWPSITFLLEVSLDESFARLQKVLAGHENESDRFEDEKERFHQRVREGFQQLAAENPRRIIRINASRTIREISDEIWGHILPRLQNVAPEE
ncbi:MAG: hypothetical protein J6S21_07105, partial [Victivallales bacterium]|nr:hypothetical protein [Victivallales bacterium]